MKKFVCETCGKEFERAWSRNLPIPKFCCKKCYGKSRENGTSTCPMCGNSFKTKHQGKKDGIKVYCSQTCARKSFAGRKSKRKIFSDEQIQYIIDNYPIVGAKPIADKFGVRIELVQAYAYKNCVKMNESSYYNAVHKKAQEYMTENNPMFNDETVEKVKEYWRNNPEKKHKILQAITEGKAKHCKKYGTKLEKKMICILNELEINYEYMFIVKENFIVDFKIGNIIIQTDGDYWHGHQRFEPLTDRQLAQQKRDRSQDKYLETCGYKVIRIWESDLSKELVIEILSKENLI